MIGRYQTLGQRIQMELEEIERTHAAIQRHWHQAKTASADQDAYLNSVALNLHSWYTGLEHIFELIAVELDGGPLGGDAWHAELLRQMTLDLPEQRPPVLRREVADRVDFLSTLAHTDS